MKSPYFLLLICLYMFAGPAKGQSFSFSAKGYDYRGTVSENIVQIDWNKSGFSKSHKGKISSCYKQSIDKELKILKKVLTGKRGQKAFGTSVETSWGEEKVSKKMFPKDIDLMDKRLSYLFHLAKIAGGKCQ